MTDRQRTLSVVIPSYGRPDRLPPLIAAFGEQSADEIVIVLDGPHPGARERLEASGVPGLRVVELATNAGLALARIRGLEVATGDVVLLADDDVLPGPGVVDAHRRFHAATPRGALVGYMPVARPAAWGRDDAPTRIYAREYEGATRRWETDPTTLPAGLWGGATSVDATLYREAEALRPSIRLDYSEDLDLGIRLGELGATARFDRSVASRHLHRRGWDAFLRESLARGRSTAALERRWADRPGVVPGHVLALVRGHGPVVRLARLLARAPQAVTTTPLAVVYAAAGWARVHRVQDLVCRLARRLLAVRAYLDAR